MIHPSAHVDPNVYIGAGTTVWANAIVRKGTIIGKDCVIGSNCYIGEHSRIGDGSRLQHGIFLPNKTIVGIHVFIGPNVTATDDKYPRVNNREYVAEPPIIMDFASIGAGAILLPGVVIGESALVGAGAVVTRSVPNGVIVVGLPAQEKP